MRTVKLPCNGGRKVTLCDAILDDLFQVNFTADSSAIKWQDWTETSSQLESVSSLAAHIHIVTAELLTQVYGELGKHLVTPKLFLDCLTMTQSIAVKIKEKERVYV